MATYSMRLAWSPEDELYVGYCPELGNLSAHGATPAEAAAALADAVDLAIEAYEGEGWALPEPKTARRYSGQFRVRLPESLHAWLAAEAEAEGVSLNTLVVAKLSEARGLPGGTSSGGAMGRSSLRPDAFARTADRR